MRVLSANFTRPADTTAYASGDLVANSTTAASVAAMQFSKATDWEGGQFYIRKVRIKKSAVGVTNCALRLHLYSTNPCTTAPTNGDNGAWVTKIAGYIGAFDVTVDKVFSDGAQGVGVPTTGVESSGQCDAGSQILYGLLEARGAYTPASAEVFTVELEVYPLK